MSVFDLIFNITDEEVVLAIKIIPSLYVKIKSSKVNSLIPDYDFEDWLDDDGFTYSSEKYKDKAHLFKELESLKKIFRQIIHTPISENKQFFKKYVSDNEAEFPSPLQVINFVEVLKNQIRKVRLMIECGTFITINSKRPSETKYYIARRYWYNNEGKKFKKFAQNLGADYKLLVDGEIPEHVIQEAEKALDKAMWNQYVSEY